MSDEDDGTSLSLENFLAEQSSCSYWQLYLGLLPLKTKIRDQGISMMVHILRADPRGAVSIGVIAPGDDTGIGNVCWDQVAEPIYFVDCPSLLTVSVKSMNSHDTAINSVSVKHT